jgi:hypothetical protein
VTEAIIVPRETKLIANLLAIENYRSEDGACDLIATQPIMNLRNAREALNNLATMALFDH